MAHNIRRIRYRRISFATALPILLNPGLDAAWTGCEHFAERRLRALRVYRGLAHANTPHASILFIHRCGTAHGAGVNSANGSCNHNGFRALSILLDDV